MREPKLPKKLTVENVRKYKAALRKWDKWRIENGIATPAEVQKENSLIPLSSESRIIWGGSQITNFSDLIDI